ASYGAAKREIMPGIEHRQHKGLNNRAENSHQPTRRRERQMKQFKRLLTPICSRKRGKTRQVDGASTPAIKDCHVRSDNTEEKPGIDIRAARFHCGLNILPCQCLVHRGPDLQEELSFLSARVAVTWCHRWVGRCGRATASPTGFRQSVCD